MQEKNLPAIDAGYWVAIVAASMCGANAGDLAAGPLGLGHVAGLLPLTIIFLAIVSIEKMFRFSTLFYYWFAIIVLRTMATNISDFATHDMKVPFPLLTAGLIIVMGVLIFLDRFTGVKSGTAQVRQGGWGAIPTTNWNYWVVMLAAGTLGTASGDWIAENDGLDFGVYWGSALCFPIFIAALLIASLYGRMTKPWYWVAIVACRTLGTDLGDMLVTMFRTLTPTRSMGLWLSTACTATLLCAIVYVWRHNRQAPPDVL